MSETCLLPLRFGKEGAGKGAVGGEEGGSAKERKLGSRDGGGGCYKAAGLFGKGGRAGRAG